MTVCKSKLREVWKCRQKDRPMGGMGCKPGDDGKSEPAGTIREALQKKKNGKMWGIFLICWPLPQFGILLFVKKKNYDLFFILEPQEHFWTSQFFKTLWVVLWPLHYFLFWAPRDPKQNSQISGRDDKGWRC